MIRRIVRTTVGLVCCIVTAGLVGTPGFAQRRVAAEASGDDANVRALLARPVTVDVHEVSVSHAVNAIARSANIRVVYIGSLDREGRVVSLRLDRVPLGVALERALAGTSLRAAPRAADLIAILSAGDLAAQAGTITGVVSDVQTKRPISSATVVLDDATHGVQTNENGVFRLAGVAVGQHSISVRRVGYMKAIRSVGVSDGNTTTVDVMLSVSAGMLDQVVVTGTVVATELKAVPTAIAVITARQLEERGITKIDQLFHGDVPGLFAQNQGSNGLLDEVVMFSRGATSFSATAATNYAQTNPIKTYVDGVELADSRYLSQIDPKSIERIEILTGPQASTIYGSNAINGVMQIFTKRGASNKPQLTLNLLSGWVENDFSTARTPQHDYGAQLNGVEGRLSYNVGSAWNYIGPWTPAKQTARLSAFGGARLELSTAAGRMTADFTLRRSGTQNQQRGNPGQSMTKYVETGWYRSTSISYGHTGPTTQTLEGQTIGVTVGYTPTAWWSHELGIGQDADDREGRTSGRAYNTIGDTTLQFSQTHTDRRSFRYATTAQVPMASVARATITAGADAWQSLTSSTSAQPQQLTGSLTTITNLSRQPGHNTGGFVQTQVAIQDRLFLTYGLRAEWNPDYGEAVQPNYAPRYGVAYTQDLGAITTKLRASYGRSTRPPAVALKRSVDIDPGNALYYGPGLSQLPNPDLGPEFQQGGEGGVELYWGTHGSLVVTQYNQTVDELIVRLENADSLDLLPAVKQQGGLRDWQYPYDIGQYVNAGSIRNQGWELQGNFNTGPFTMQGTYSWTKSRTIGVKPQYRSFFTVENGYAGYQPGATYRSLPEHTWAWGVTYTRPRTTVALNVNGIGPLGTAYDALFIKNLYGSLIRLPQNNFNMSAPGRYNTFNKGYAMADLNTSCRFSSYLEGIVQVQNLTDHHANDLGATYATIGRQGKVGVRVRM